MVETDLPRRGGARRSRTGACGAHRRALAHHTARPGSATLSGARSRSAGCSLPGGRAPVALAEVLEAGELLHQPDRASPRCAGRGMRRDPGLDLATLVEQEAAELDQRQAAVLVPLGTQALGVDVVHGHLQVRVQVELPGGLVVERQGMPGHGNVVEADDHGAGATAWRATPGSARARRYSLAARWRCIRAGEYRAAGAGHGST